LRREERRDATGAMMEVYPEECGCLCTGRS